MYVSLTSQLLVRKYFSAVIGCTLFFLVSSNVTQAQNLLTNGDFGTGDLSGWLMASANADQTTITYASAEGLPAGSALLDRVDSTLDDNKDIIYQLVDVEVGKQYKVNADWKGDLFNGGDGRNWAEAMVQFVATGDPISDGTLFPDSWIQYKKATAGGPNEPPTTGFDWESILASPDAGPADGIFTATDEWMLFGFNLGGRDAADSRHTLVAPGYYYLDNATVTQVPEPASAVLVAIGSLAIVSSRRRRRQ